MEKAEQRNDDGTYSAVHEILPEEIWIKIFMFCDLNDILSCRSSCKYLRKTAESDYLWKLKWMRLASQSNFTFPEMKDLQTMNVNFMKMCFRLKNISSSNSTKCLYCKRYTCTQSCLEDRCSKVVLDIGNKFTWIITANFGLKRHLSMLGVPRRLKCMDCDANIERTSPFIMDEDQLSCRLSEELSSESFPTCIQDGVPTKLSHHTGLQYCSQDLQKLEVLSDFNGAFCIFCDQSKLPAFFQESHCVQRVSKTKISDSNSSEVDELSNGFCADTLKALKISNVDVVSPASALKHVKAFPVLKLFVKHLLNQMNLLEDLRRPNGMLLFCEPIGMPRLLKVKLLNYLFIQEKISRLCLVPKPIAVCSIVGVNTCVVIDSGALNTSVAVVINGQVLDSCTQHVPDGGWHVAEYLKGAMCWHKKYDKISVSNLDVVGVKEKCRLCYNISAEDKRQGPSRQETIYLQLANFTAANSGEFKLEEITLSSELYLAPEMMYAYLNLPNLIKKAVKGLSDSILKECLSHILLTGGNTEMVGFSSRLSRDLRELMPEFSTVINVQGCQGSRSWNVAMGSTCIPVPSHDGSSSFHVSGMPFWISREEFVLYGSDLLPK